MPLLEPFARDIWIASGPVVSTVGFRYPTRMAIIRLSDGGIFIWSPVAPSPELRDEIDTLGPVRFLVAPNSLHHVFLPHWRAAYPAAILYAPPGLRERRKDIAFEADLGDEPPKAWAGQVDQVPVRGNRITTEIVFFHRASSTVLFTDLIQHFPKGWFKGWRAIIAGLDGMTGSRPQVPQKFRIAFADRKAARESVKLILVWPAEKVLMAHADPIRENGRAFIEQAFRWLG
ncbi:MAG: DUF4336 domain-containing protein [Hyphomonadaceae bacterium]